MSLLLKDAPSLRAHITAVLNQKRGKDPVFPKGVARSNLTSAVLFLLATRCYNSPAHNQPCVVLNKRSMRVRQPGDLCFPGGRIDPRLDACLAKGLKLPFSPLVRWPYWGEWRRERRQQARRLSLLLATSLRESLEEMRLNPWGVTFLGPMPPQELRMFQRVLYPMVVWITRQSRFFPNWEVEKIVYIPLQNLVNPEYYGCYRLHFQASDEGRSPGFTEDFPCFCHENEQGKDVLWGVTYRIVTAFLEMVFGFCPPDVASRPVIYGALDQQYLTGPPPRWLSHS